MKYTILLVAGLLLSLAACVSREKHEVRLWGEAQGSTYSIIYIDEAKRNFQDEIEAILNRIDLSMSTWLPNSLISQLNEGKSVVMDEDFAKVMKTSFEIYEKSDGYFDITVASIVNAWGLGNQTGLSSLSEQQVDSLKNLIGMQSIQLSGDTVEFAKPGMKIDFNAIAQGYTVDLVAELLESEGIFDYMVEIGGEIRTAGQNAKGKDWRIGIDKPIDDTKGRPLQVILKISDKALATSGSYRKFRMEDGIRYSHAVNPLTGRPVSHSLLSVTVVGENCMMVDAYATAFLVMGVESSIALVEQIPDMEAYFISDDGAGGFQIEMSQGFSKYILEDVFE